MQMKVHKDEKTGRFWFVISAGKDEKGNRRQIKRRGFKTEKEAMHEMRKIMQQLDDHTYVKSNNLKYVEFLEGEWLASKELKLRSVTFKTYKSNIKKHIAPYFKNQEMGKIATVDIGKFYAFLLKETGLSERSIQDIQKIVKSSFKTAFKRKYIAYNTAADAEAPKVPHKEMAVWNLDEAVRFLKLAEEDELHIAFLLALTTGMRQSEILGLRWKDIDFDEGALRVRQTLSHDGKELVQATKTKSSARTITLIERTLDDLKKQHKKIMKQKLAAGSDYKDNDLVICTKSGKPLNPRNLLRNFYRLIKKADVSCIRFHDLRHTVATLMLAQNINPKVVKEILGHSDIRVTLDTYSHVLPSVHKQTAKQYGEMLFR
ncbi:tyrosine-type recombinase/integrase [Paenibacillus sp. 1001270B_150601_E10]|uniref:tyrosine-type recombinase/integrase n=1 Tax=Paenibacillus sp. 1001270B_150601_E10 TaxID=2787079 RepID=UPI00189EFC9A|nr:tyrosine-type recombinase/integrase [Paenibacillus sp. 1001270B_150601_E10]